MTMDQTTAGSQNAVTVSAIFLQQFSFDAFLERNKVIHMYLSETQKNKEGVRVKRAKTLPFFKFADTPIWIANKLKDLCDSETKMKTFEQELLLKGGDYSVGLTKPSEQYPTPSWILFKNGDGGIVATSTMTYEDMILARGAGNIKK